MIWWNHFAWNFGIEDGDGIRLNSRMVDILFIVLYLVVFIFVFEYPCKSVVECLDW